MTAPRRRKKPRGWRRRMRELDRWAAEHGTLNLRSLRQSDYWSQEIWFRRWPHPYPTAVRRRIVEHLVGIHDRWLVELRELDEPFYLGIWLFEPAMTESQVVAATGPRAEEYRGRHSPAKRSPPPALYHGHPCDLARFEWTRNVWVEHDRLSSFSEEQWPEVLRDARSAERVGDDVALTFGHDDWFAVLRE